MTEPNLTSLLERTAAHTPVGPPPLDALRAGAARRRHRRTAVVAAAAAVAAVVAGSALLVPRTSTPPAAPAPAPGPTRLVGLGHAAIAVPAEWGTDKSRCGTPQADTVLVDNPSAARECLAFRPAGVESVALGVGSPRAGFHVDETFEIDGVRAERQATTCQVSNRSTPEPAVCSGTVFIPSLKVWFTADSSTDAAEVEQVLRGIEIVADRSGVLSPWTIGGPPTGPLLTSYTPLLAEVGLTAQPKRVKSPNYPSGTILGVSPASGTMLPLGATVTVTVAR